MAGYAENYSKSNNALAAESGGMFPASICAKKLKVPTAVITDNCDSTEWHHTSCRYNMTDYYDLDDVREYVESDEGKQAIAEYRQAKKAEETITHHGCDVKWLVWGGTRRRPTADEFKVSYATVAVKGQTATITLADGTTFRKRLTTNGFEFRTENEIPPYKKRFEQGLPRLSPPGWDWWEGKSCKAVEAEAYGFFTLKDCLSQCGVSLHWRKKDQLTALVPHSEVRTVGMRYGRELMRVKESYYSLEMVRAGLDELGFLPISKSVAK